MKRFQIVSAILAVSILASFAPAAGAQVDYKQVAPGVYAALQPFANRFNDSNSTIIIGEDSVIVVDSQTTLTATRGVIEQIRKLTDKPVRFVINTHWHSDHVQGNQEYRAAFPGVQFISQANTREDMSQRTSAELKEQVEKLPAQIEQYKQMRDTGNLPSGKPLTEDQKKLAQMRYEVFSSQLPDLQKTHIVLPDMTFEQSMVLWQGTRELRLMHYVGHTRGDLAVYLPAEKILITGDLLDDMPYTGDGSPAGLIATLHDLDKFDFASVIPGHGPVEQGHDHLRLVTQLFESIVTQVQAAVTAGLSLEDTKKKVDLEKFRLPLTGGEEHGNRAFDGFIRGDAVEKAYQELTAAKK